VRRALLLFAAGGSKRPEKVLNEIASQLFEFGIESDVMVALNELLHLKVGAVEDVGVMSSVRTGVVFGVDWDTALG
jgi:menaquinone-dependent protoporphyrinogen IX oxidase